MNVLYLLRKQERETHPKPKKHSIINTKNNYLKGVKNNHKEAVIPAETEHNSTDTKQQHLEAMKSTPVPQIIRRLVAA
jgi:hypothetical protein